MRFFLLALVVAGTALGDLLKTIGMKRGGAVEDFAPGALGRRLGRAFASAWILLSIGAYAVSFFAFLALLSVAELSFAAPATASAYVVETLLARAVLGEAVSGRRWAGVAAVVAGVVLVSL